MWVTLDYSDGRYTMRASEERGDAFLIEDRVFAAYEAHISQDRVYQDLMTKMEQLRDLERHVCVGSDHGGDVHAGAVRRAEACHWCGSTAGYWDPEDTGLPYCIDCKGT